MKLRFMSNNVFIDENSIRHEIPYEILREECIAYLHKTRNLSPKSIFTKVVEENLMPGYQLVFNNELKGSDIFKHLENDIISDSYYILLQSWLMSKKNSTKAIEERKRRIIVASYDANLSRRIAAQQRRNRNCKKGSSKDNV